MRVSFLGLIVPFVAFLSVLVGAGAHDKPPAVILVPGAFHRPNVYYKAMQILRRDRYRDLFTIHLPSLGTLEGRQADVNVVRSFLSQQLNKGKDVLLVGNSYGGTVIGEAVKDFISFSSVSTTPTPPGKGRILGLIFLSGYIPYITEVTQPQTRPDIKTVSPSFFRFNETGRVFWDNDLENYPPSKTFYNLLSAKDAQFWSSRLDFSAFAALNATATYIPYTGDFKCVYAVGLQDNSIPPAFAYTFINQPGANFTVETLNSDHISPLSVPYDVAGLIKKYSE